MRILFPSRFRSRLVNSIGLLLFTLAAGSLSCENKHIGRPCDLSTGPDAGPNGGTTATIDEGLECPSRICLLPTRDTFSQDPPTSSLCTADCSSDDDCADGELRNASNPSGCVAGFVCKIPETVGDFCCRHLCVCKDFSGKPPTGGFTRPQVCDPTPENKLNCRNL
jgi:hypothetical protein